MTDRADFYWNIIQLLMTKESDSFILAFQYLLSEVNARSGVLWDTNNEMVPIYTTITQLDASVASRCVAAKTTLQEGDTICVPILYEDTVLLCLQITGANDFSLINEAAELFEKQAKSGIDRISPQKNAKTVISVRDVKKNFTLSGKIIEVLKGVSFDVYENELLVILGASGTGKTTLLNILGGLDKADSGSIVVADLDLVAANDKQLNNYLRNDVGFVFQFYSLMPSLTAEENLRYIAEIVPNTMSVQSALEKVDLWAQRKHFPSQLSSGQQQRVAIARALIKKPKIILADEPTGALDLATSKDVLVAMEEITASKQGTIVLITHNKEICKIADRVIVMRQGLIDSITVNPRKQSATQLRW
ncbi:MAG: ABC transporter ATP-binding protein [Lachnospiraceae bacterium]